MCGHFMILFGLFTIKSIFLFTVGELELNVISEIKLHPVSESLQRQSQLKGLIGFPLYQRWIICRSDRLGPQKKT